MYTVRGEVSLAEVEYTFTHFIVACDDKSSVAADKSVIYREVLIEDFSFF